MIAQARIGTTAAGVTRLRSEPPIALRDTPDGVYIVGSAANPLGSDDLSIDIDVAAGSDLTIRASAASVVLPGASPSRVSIHAKVGRGARLRWMPEPTVLVRRCRHQIETVVVLDGDAELEWWEELVLGRHGEISGSATTRLSIDLDGQPFLRHQLAVGPEHPASSSAAVLGAGTRAVGSVTLVGAGRTWRSVVLGDAGAVLPLDGPGALVTAVAADALSLRHWLVSGVDASRAGAASTASNSPK